MEQALMPPPAMEHDENPKTPMIATRSSVDVAALISNLSHGLRTPLNPVVGFIELLLDTELDPTQREYLVQAHSGALEIRRLLTSLTTGPNEHGHHITSRHRPGAVTGSQPCPRPEAWSPRVLVVDDDPVNRQVAEHMAKRLGYATDMACDGIEAVQLALDSEYDLILMDLQMPHMGGLEAIETIREGLPWYRQPMIYAVTAGAASGDEDRLEVSGMDGCVTKPVRLHELDEVMEIVLQSPRASRAWALSLQPPDRPVVDLDALDDWVGSSGLTTSLVELIVPSLIPDLDDLIGRLPTLQPGDETNILALSADLFERADSVFVTRLAWVLEHLIEALGRSDRTAAATLFEPLQIEYTALMEWTRPMDS